MPSIHAGASPGAWTSVRSSGHLGSTHGLLCPLRTLSFFGLFLILFLPSCKRSSPGTTPAAVPQLPTEVDLGHGYVRRDGIIHFIGGGVTGSAENATRIDMPSRELLKMFMDAQYGSFRTAEGLDAASFEALSEEYTRDKDRVYYKEIAMGQFLVMLLPDADPATFEVLSADFARDKDRVWHRNRPVAGADSATVRMVDASQVLKDKNSVYYGTDLVQGADATTFRHIASGYYADKNRVYCGSDPIPGADGASFAVLGNSFFAKDKTAVYRSGKRMPGFDLGSLELILFDPAGYHIVADQNGLYLDNKRFPRSKPGKVEVIDPKTIKGGSLVHVVCTYNEMAITLFKEEGRLMAEAFAYDPMNHQLSGTIVAEVTEHGLKHVQTKPAPGDSAAPSVPSWQIDRLRMPDTQKRMFEAGQKIP